MISSRKLLIIEDSEADLEIYRRFLSRDPYKAQVSYELHSVQSIQEAISICQTQAFEIILLDYLLPDDTGLAFLEHWITGLPFNPAIIMLTGYGNETIAVEALHKGAHDYLVKRDVTAEKLHHAINTALTQIQLKTRLEQARVRQGLITDTALQIRQSLNLNQILNSCVSELRQLLRCDRALIYQYDDCQSHHLVAESVAPEFSNESAASVDSSNSGVTFNSTILYETPHQQIASAWGEIILQDLSTTRIWTQSDQMIVEEVLIHLGLAIQHAQLLSTSESTLQQQQALHRLKSNIIETVSHEYRTPISSILGAAATLQRFSSQIETEKIQTLIEMIAKQARHMGTLVDQMTMVNQLDLGHISIEPTPVDLEVFFQGLIERFESYSPEAYHLALDFDEHCDDFQGDLSILTLIFENLLSNALKFSLTDAVIQIQVQGSEQQIKVSIQDQGIGIPHTEIPQVFQTFSRGSNVDNRPGLGVGLSIAKACIALHQGHITMTSQTNKCTEVCVILPKKPKQITQELIPQ